MPKIKLILMGVLSFVLITLTACNTVQGMGKDVQQGTRAIGETFD